MSKTPPTRVKSQLGGMSFLEPSRTATADPDPTTSPASVASTRTAAPAAEVPKKKVAYYAADEENGRIRAAFLAGRDKYGWRSFTDFQLETMLDRVALLEAEFNGGRPFEGVPPKAGPLGRPLD